MIEAIAEDAIGMWAPAALPGVLARPCENDSSLIVDHARDRADQPAWLSWFLVHLVDADHDTSVSSLYVPDLVFFYGTLMAGFDRRRRAGIDDKLKYIGRGSIQGALFDLGLYPAAVPAPDGRIWGEVYEMADSPVVLAALDDIEGYRDDDPDKSLYVRSQADVALPGGGRARAWVYFYNAPLGRAARIPSGDYLEHVKVR